MGKAQKLMAELSRQYPLGQVQIVKSLGGDVLGVRLTVPVQGQCPISVSEYAHRDSIPA